LAHFNLSVLIHTLASFQLFTNLSRLLRIVRTNGTQEQYNLSLFFTRRAPVFPMIIPLTVLLSFTHSFINGSTALCWVLVSSSVRNLFYADGRTPLTGDQPVARPLPTHKTTQTQNKRMHRHPCLE
jgi:hypothetical protein